MSELRFFSSLNIPANNFPVKMRRYDISKIDSMPPQSPQQIEFALIHKKKLLLQVKKKR